jgi:hypothetical protein
VKIWRGDEYILNLLFAIQQQAGRYHYSSFSLSSSIVFHWLRFWLGHIINSSTAAGPIVVMRNSWAAQQLQTDE